LRTLTSLFRLLRETPVLYDEWLNLVETPGISEVQVYDARLAAIMRINGLTHMLTFNPDDLTRSPGITAAHPQDV